MYITLLDGCTVYDTSVNDQLYIVLYNEMHIVYI